MKGLATGVWRLTLIVLAANARADAQVIREPQGVPAPPPAGPRTLVGIVNDSSGVPADSVELRIAELDRAARSDRDGRFRFDNVKPGTYRLSARRIGFLPQVRTVEVGPKGGATAFALVPYVRSLAPSLTSATRGGLSGVVGDTAYAVVAGALVDVMGSGRHATSDSTGKFFVDVAPGHYMVRVSREGFASQLLGVTVPPDSGRRVVFWLRPGHANPFEVANAFDLRWRLATASSARSRVFTHEDILRLNPRSSMQLTTMGAVRAVDDRCEAIVDGGPFKVPIWSFDPEDIEFYEVYSEPPPRAGAVSRPRRIGPSVGTGGCPTIYVWLRK